MTSAELRRLADSKVVEARVMQRSVDRLRSQAALLRGLLDPLVSISQRVWLGPAARNFEVKSRAHGRLVDGQADLVLRIATEMEAESRELMSAATSLRARALAVDTASAATPGIEVGVIQ